MSNAEPSKEREPRRRETREQRRERIAQRIAELPQEPGCYLMKDARGDIFYVGKATSLRERVRQYFSGQDTRQFVDWLDDLLVDLDIIVVRNEKEALLLERTLVRTHQPRFNVKLRDDKNFIHLRLRTKPKSEGTRRQRYPRVEVVRGPQPNSDVGVRTFGPFHSATAARQTLRVLNKHFQLRSCRDSVLENRVRPCLQFQIGRCPAPCVYDVPSYGESLIDTAMFLGGKKSELHARLKTRMHDAAEREDFESAARARDQLAFLATALDEQVVTDVEHRRDQDVWVCERRGSLLVIVRVIVRDGRMEGMESHDFDKAEFDTSDLMGSVLVQHYDSTDAAQLPDEVLLGDDIGVWSASLAEMLSDKKGRRVTVSAPQRGQRVQLVDIARRNAVVTIDERARKDDVREKGLAVLRERAGMKRMPRVIECYDISLFQGEDAVASQVCFVDGEPDKSRYRKMNIKGVSGTDDFAMLYEAVTRRLKRGIEQSDLPDLLLIDGGKGQLNAAIAACKDSGVRIENAVDADLVAGADGPDGPVVALASVAKARSFTVSGTTKRGARPATPREDREGIVDDELQMSPERLFLPGAKDPLVLRQHTPERFLIERLRDEAHRFAITAHRARRKRRTLASVLDEIDGVGPVLRKRLLSAFGSVDAVGSASVPELVAVKGVSAVLANAIHQALAADDET